MQQVLEFVTGSGYDCKPGTSWKADCNNCFCTQNGHAICTLKACPPLRNERDTPTPEEGTTINYLIYYWFVYIIIILSYLTKCHRYGMWA